MLKLHNLHAIRKYLSRALRYATAMALASAIFFALPNSLSVASPGDNQPSQRSRIVDAYGGEAVRMRAQQLRITNKALARAMRDFEQRGLQPNWESSVTVLSMNATTAAAFAPAAIRRVSYTQDTISDGTSEMTFITYNASSSVWEGIIYIHSPYENDAYSAYLGSPNSGWDVVYEYWYPPDGGDPTCTDGDCPILSKNETSPRNKISPQPSLVKTSYSRAVAKPARGIWGRIKRWWNCTKGGCYWGSQPCTGFLCKVRVCAQAALGCLFQ